jgi:hypothetical protein
MPLIRNLDSKTLQEALPPPTSDFILLSIRDPIPATSSILDTGASTCAVKCKSVFITFTELDGTDTIGGIAGGLPVLGKGTTRWHLHDDWGQPFYIDVPDSLYVPGLPETLLSPQTLCQKAKCNGIEAAFCIMAEHAILLYQGRSVTVNYDKSNMPRLPIYNHKDDIPQKSLLSSVPFCFQDVDDCQAFLSSAPKVTLSKNQRILLDLHIRHGHESMKTIQEWSRHDETIPACVRRVKNFPVCMDCQLGRAKKKSIQKGKTIRKEDMRPGELVCVDQMVAGQDGRKFTTQGRRSSRYYRVMTLFIDVASDLRFPHFQESTAAKETVEGKHRFEAYCRQHKHTVQEYRVDNGVFVSKTFKQDVEKHEQKQSIAGVGAHHQNGIVERGIGSHSEWSRTMLIYGRRRWPEMIDSSFWPFAMKHSCNLYNWFHKPRSPKQGTRCPFTVFTQDDAPVARKHLHPLFCPVFVLQKRLQDGDRMPSKWIERARVGVYVGHSSMHSGNVALVYNPMTGHTSPQFHCVFDDEFSSVAALRDDDVDLSELDKIFASLLQNQIWEHEGDFPSEYRFDDFWGDGAPAKPYREVSFELPPAPTTPYPSHPPSGPCPLQEGVSPSDPPVLVQPTKGKTTIPSVNESGDTFPTDCPSPQATSVRTGQPDNTGDSVQGCSPPKVAPDTMQKPTLPEPPPSKDPGTPVVSQPDDTDATTATTSTSTRPPPAPPPKRKGTTQNQSTEPTKRRTKKHKQSHASKTRSGRIIRRRVLPTLMAELNAYMVRENIDAEIETWFSEGDSPDSKVPVSEGDPNLSAPEGDPPPQDTRQPDPYSCWSHEPS